MSDTPTSDKPAQEQPPPRHKDPVSPEALMNDFRGKPLMKILIFTLLIHAVFIGVFSLGYLKNQVLGADTAELSEDERMDLAVREATSVLQDIAQQHQVSFQGLSSRFADNAGDSAAQPDGATRSPSPADDAPPATRDQDFEQTQERAPGPALPALTDDLGTPAAEDEDDLFADPNAP